MIRRLKHGAEDIRNSYKEMSYSTLYFRFFMKSRFLWSSVHMFCWLLAGATFGILFLDTVGLVPSVMIFYFLGEIRRSRPWAYAESTRTQRRWTQQWNQMNLYRNLIDHLEFSLCGYSDIYRYSSSNALFEMNSISWEFTTTYSQPM